MWIDVLTAFAVVVSVGLLLGLLLALFINLFGIEEDEKAKQIRAILPGINCGACGFKGCNDYANAISKGLAKPNLCIPGAETTAQELSELLGVEVEEPKDMISFIHCNGVCDATTEKAICDGIATCKARAALYGGPKSCHFGCLGCGDCASVCLSHAISIQEGVAKVDPTLCIGCGMCVAECPKKIISMIPRDAASIVFCSSKDKGADARKVCKNACIGCKKCEKVCPSQAISVINNCAVIDYTKCSKCGLCADTCPTKCIKNVSFPELSEEFSLK